LYENNEIFVIFGEIGRENFQLYTVGTIYINSPTCFESIDLGEEELGQKLAVIIGEGGPVIVIVAEKYKK